MGFLCSFLPPPGLPNEEPWPIQSSSSSSAHSAPSPSAQITVPLLASAVRLLLSRPSTSPAQLSIGWTQCPALQVVPHGSNSLPRSIIRGLGAEGTSLASSGQPRISHAACEGRVPRQPTGQPLQKTSPEPISRLSGADKRHFTVFYCRLSGVRPMRGGWLASG